MKAITVAGWVGVLLAVAGWMQAGEPAGKTACSAEFQRMKTLVGTWRGEVDMGQGPKEMTLQYRLIAGGSVVEERCLAGTPEEMVTMYFDQGGKLALTHYCIMGNRPAMFLKASDATSISFDLDPTCGIETSKESHMHALKLRFVDADTLATSCKAMLDGKVVEEKENQFKRVKAS